MNDITDKTAIALTASCNGSSVTAQLPDSFNISGMQCGFVPCPGPVPSQVMNCCSSALAIYSNFYYCKPANFTFMNDDDLSEQFTACLNKEVSFGLTNNSEFGFKATCQLKNTPGTGAAAIVSVPMSRGGVILLSLLAFSLLYSI